MYIDSQITEMILLYFADRNIPVLPMHDSYIIDARAVLKLVEIMGEIVYENFQRHVKISNDNLEHLVSKIMAWASKQVDAGNTAVTPTQLEDFKEVASDAASNWEIAQLAQIELAKRKAEQFCNCKKSRA